MAETVPQYRLVVFEEIEDPKAVRDLFCRVTHLHPTDAMQWIARTPGTWPWPLPADEVRALLDGLYDLGVAAEAWHVDHFPELSPPRNVHDVANHAEHRIAYSRRTGSPGRRSNCSAPGGSRPRTSSATSSRRAGARRWPSA